MYSAQQKIILTELALPKDSLLMVGPLAKVEIDGSSVPPNAISTSFGGCLELERIGYKSFRWSLCPLEDVKMGI